MFEIILLLCHKENRKLTESALEDAHIFFNPLLFAFFNNKKYNYFKSEVFDEVLYENNVFEKLSNTKIKLLKSKHQVLNGTFTKNEIPLDYQIIDISKDINQFFLTKLTNAIAFLKVNVTYHFKLIEEHCKAICLFKTSPEHTNSFATINAHGMAFINIYQWQDYGEVFFVDDISHQTGHIIMNSFWFNRKQHFILDENQGIKEIVNDPKEYRSFYILFHALYTYYASIMCLESCIDHKSFNEAQELEASARIVFYLRKYIKDLMKFEQVCKHYGGIDKVVNQESQNIYIQIKEKFKYSIKRWQNQFKTHKYDNQPYNFTFSIFKDDNPNLIS